jgi:hypothetical protein
MVDRVIVFEGVIDTASYLLSGEVLIMHSLFQFIFIYLIRMN